MLTCALHTHTHHHQRLTTTSDGALLRAMASATFPLAKDTKIPDLRHFVYKHIPSAQYVCTEWSAPYVTCSKSAASEARVATGDAAVASVDSPSSPTTPLVHAQDSDIHRKLRKSLICAYRRMHVRLHNPHDNCSFVYQNCETEAYFAWVSLRSVCSEGQPTAPGHVTRFIYVCIGEQ